MKRYITKFIKPALLALLGLALLAPSAKAGDGDLYLGFYSTSAAKDYLLYIGSYTNYTTNGGAFTGSSFSLNTGIGIGTASQINADLTTAFGAGWFSDPTVKWGVIGGLDYFGTNTVFLSDPNATSTTTAWTALGSDDQRIAVADAVVGLSGQFGSGGAGGATAANGKLQDKSVASTYYFYSKDGSNSPGASFEYYTGGIDTNARTNYLATLVATDNGGSGLLADGSQVVDGKFTVASDGNISYATAAAVPEPSTYAILGFGAVILSMAARRKVCKA